MQTSSTEEVRFSAQLSKVHNRWVKQKVPVSVKDAGGQKGLGAFAARVLLSGQFIGEFTGTVCDESKLARDNPYVFRLGKGTYL